MKTNKPEIGELYKLKEARRVLPSPKLPPLLDLIDKFPITNPSDVLLVVDSITDTNTSEWYTWYKVLGSNYLGWVSMFGIINPAWELVEPVDTFNCL